MSNVIKTKLEAVYQELEGATATRNTTRYNGEAYTKAINDWRVTKGMATHTEGTGYLKTDTDKYDAVEFVNMYNLTSHGTGTTANKRCFLPDGADLWDQFTQKYLILKACDKINAGGGGYTTGNCYPIRDGSFYWTSAENVTTNAWCCRTTSALFYYSGKWVVLPVRPSFAIEAV